MKIHLNDLKHLATPLCADDLAAIAEHFEQQADTSLAAAWFWSSARKTAIALNVVDGRICGWQMAMAPTLDAARRFGEMMVELMELQHRQIADQAAEAIRNGAAH